MPNRADPSHHGGLTLGQCIALAFAGLALLLIVLLSVFYAGSRKTVLLASEQLMRQASRRVSERLDGHFGEAERVVAALEAEAALGLVTRDTLEPVLLGVVSAHPLVTDVTFTYGDAVGTYERDEPPHDAGDLRLAPGHSGQVSVSRSVRDEGSLMIRRLRPTADGWRSEERRAVPHDGIEAGGAAAAATETVAMDPTLHATFTTPSRPEFRDRALWSDLAFYEPDGSLPEAERRRVVSVQKALWSPGGAFVGVVRVALQSDRIDELAHIQVDDAAVRDDHLVFLWDGRGRLISRLDPHDGFALLDPEGRPDPEGDVRVAPAALPPQVAAALAAPEMEDPSGRDAMVTRLDVGGVSYLFGIATLLGDRTRGWRVGIVVPEAHYLGALEASRRRVLAAAAALMLVAAVAAALMLRAMRRDLGHLIGETTRLRSFDFSPSPHVRGTFRDVAAASESLEQAKTALRALGKYVPLDLVRQLYDARREPTLEAELQDVTILFSDVAGFTTVAERLAPDDLATALGAYLETLTRAIHATGGIIDKYTGDGVMALWNTPRPIDRHATRACEAALACVEATRALFASPAWQGRAPWPTRFGIHRAVVNVGHFGAPDRLSFTAMGDGVNLASRLESLGKQYGAELLVSAAVEREARATFWFRRLDRVAVKGKQEGVEIFELLGRRIDGDAAPSVIAPYEAALDAYFAGRFAEALTLLLALPADSPSQVLAARCRRFIEEPPAADWNGVYVAAEK